MADDPKLVTGENLSIPFPTSIESLQEQGVDWLTSAFRAAGALGDDNRVTSITRFDEFVGGGAGRKLWLSVAYERDEPGLHTELFVKYPRDFGDPLRALFAHLMQPETKFALLSRRSGFPVPVPTCYFADYDPETATGLLITERIRYGENGIDPFFDKCLDYELPDPLERYQALITAIAKLSAGHHSGQLGTHVSEQFPFELGQVRPDDMIPYNAEELVGKLDILQAFAEKYPNLLPANISSKEFLSRFAQEAPRFLERELEIKKYLNGNPDYIALCHWNANVDNAWFERNAAGELEAGLLDFGSVGQMNVAQSVYGILCATDTDIWDAHKNSLVDLFVDEYAKHGGPVLDREEFHLNVQLFIALLGICWMLDAPSLVEAQLPDLPADADRKHQMFRDDFLARAQLQLMTVFLHSWETENLAGALDRLPRA